MNTLRNTWALSLLAVPMLALAACGNDDESNGVTQTAEDTYTVEPGAGPIEPEPRPGVITTVSQSSATDYPVVNPDAYVGTWGATDNVAGDGQPDCENMWWRFAPTQLSTAGESSCTLSAPTISGNTFTLAANCTAEGAVTQDTFHIVFAPVVEPDSTEPMALQNARPQSMTIRRNDGPAVALRRCV